MRGNIYPRTKVISLFLSIGLLVGASSAVAQTTPGERWGVEANAGFMARTMVGSAFAMGAVVDYRLTSAVSVGPLAFVSSGVGLTGYAVAGVGRYHLSAGPANVVPFAGLGFMHVDYEGDQDLAFYLPTGVALEVPFQDNLFTLTLMTNLHAINLDPAPGRDRASVAVLFGVRHEM